MVWNKCRRTARTSPHFILSVLERAGNAVIPHLNATGAIRCALETPACRLCPSREEDPGLRLHANAVLQPESRVQQGTG